MPDLQFDVTGVAPAARGLTPLLQFEVEVSNAPASQAIHTAILQVQIQIEPARRHYSAEEKEKLADLFGEPDRWGQTLRNSLWTHAVTTLRGFSGKTRAALPVPCTYDLNVSAAKYFFALEDGEVSLLFLFSGTVFYEAGGRLQAELIPWSKEARFRMPVQRWRELMDHHYPNCAWLSLRRDVFDQLYAFKRQHGLTSWEAAIERLLEEEGVPDPVSGNPLPLAETVP